MASEAAGEHAIDIGGSIAGLLATQALGPHYRMVTIERDVLPEAAVARKGVPQGRHAHVLVQGGQDALEMLFAGTGLDLAAAGALRTDAGRDIKWFQFRGLEEALRGARRPHWHVHLTPTSASWLNQVERFFAELTAKQIRRGVHRSLGELETAIQRYLTTVNDDPKPFRWTRSADQILASINRFCLRTLETADHQRAMGTTSESGH